MKRDARRGCERLREFRDARIMFGLEENGLAVRETHGDADGRRRDVQLGQVEDLARLLDDLELFAAIAVRVEPADLRNHVARDRRGERYGRRLVCLLRERLLAGGEFVEAGPARRR